LEKKASRTRTTSKREKKNPIGSNAMRKRSRIQKEVTKSVHIANLDRGNAKGKRGVKSKV